MSPLPAPTPPSPRLLTLLSGAEALSRTRDLRTIFRNAAECAMRFLDGVERQIHGQQLANDRFIQKQRHKISPIQMDAKQQWTDFNGIPAHAGGHSRPGPAAGIL